mgnify:CR=1 FL=1
MRIFLWGQIFSLLLYPFLLNSASISSQQKDEIKSRLERVQSLLHSIKPSHEKIMPKLLPEVKASHSEDSSIVEPEISPALPAGKYSLKVKRSQLQERINKAEALLRSIKVKDSVDSSKLLPRSEEFLDKIMPSPPSVPELSHQITPSFSSKESKYNQLKERINRADALLKSLEPRENPVASEVPETQPEGVRSVVSPPREPLALNQEKQNLGLEGKGGAENDLGHSDLHSREESSEQVSFKNDTSHEIRFQLSYAYPFSSTFITTSGEAVPLEYEAGVQGEVQYLHAFSHLALGASILWSEQHHKRLGPLPYTGYVNAKGETRSFGGSLLGGFFVDLSDRLSLDSILSLGLVRRLDRFQISDIYFSEAGVSCLYSLSLGINMEVYDNYKIGLFGKYQAMNGLTRNSESENFQLGASLGLEF